MDLYPEYIRSVDRIAGNIQFLDARLQEKKLKSKKYEKKRGVWLLGEGNSGIDGCILRKDDVCS